MSLTNSVVSRFEKTFGSEPEVVAFAPGRVEVIGNHTDHNQGPVIGAAIDRGVALALRRIEERVFRFRSSSFPLVETSEYGAPLTGSSSWANYPLGVFNVLLGRGLEASGGFELAVESDLPSGAGLSSSAALENASGKAFCEVYGFELSTKDLALVGREAENNFVGVPCGILDQGVSAFGKANSLVHIDCRELAFSTIDLGGEYSIWIFNTHKKHSLVESMYATRHEECFKAVKQLNDAGLSVDYLADVSVAEFERLRERLEPVTSKRAEHIIREIARVNDVKSALATGDMDGVGEALFASHASSRDLFENSVPELDYLVRILKSMPNVIGARLTGGGFGGAAMALTSSTFSDEYAESVASAYRGEFGEAPVVIQCGIGGGARVVNSVPVPD